VASNASAGSARTASANARLSVGSYLQGGKSISGGSSIKSQNPASGGGSVGSGNAAVQDQVDKLEVRVDDLESNVIDLKDDVNNNVKKDIVDLQKGVNDLQTDLDNKVQSLEGSKQDVLQAGVGIIIDTNTNTISASGVATSTDVEELERKVNKNITDIAAVEQSVLSQDVNVGKIITALVGATATADELAALGPLGSLARKSSVDTADIANLAVTTDKLDAGAVTKTKLEVDIQNKLQVLPSSAPSTALGKDYVMVVNDQAGVGQWVEVAYPPTSP
jgi:TolA-binding protein